MKCRRKQPSNFLVIWTSVTHLEEVLVYGILIVFFRAASLSKYSAVFLFQLKNRECLGFLSFFLGKVQVLCMSSLGELPWSHLYTAVQAGLVTPKLNLPKRKLHIFSSYILFGDFSANNSTVGQNIFPYWLVVKAKFSESNFCGFLILYQPLRNRSQKAN